MTPNQTVTTSRTLRGQPRPAHDDGSLPPGVRLAAAMHEHLLGLVRQPGRPAALRQAAAVGLFAAGLPAVDFQEHSAASHVVPDDMIRKKMAPEEMRALAMKPGDDAQHVEKVDAMVAQ